METFWYTSFNWTKTWKTNICCRKSERFQRSSKKNLDLQKIVVLDLVGLAHVQAYLKPCCWTLPCGLEVLSTHFSLCVCVCARVCLDSKYVPNVDLRSLILSASSCAGNESLYCPFCSASMTSGDIVVKILWNKRHQPTKGLWTTGCLDSRCTIKSNLSSPRFLSKWNLPRLGVWNLVKVIHGLEVYFSNTTRKVGGTCIPCLG